MASKETSTDVVGNTAIQQMKDLGLSSGSSSPKQSFHIVADLQETQPLSTEEMKRAKACLTILTSDEKSALSMVLLTNVLRGYWTYPKQPDDTANALKKINRFFMGKSGFEEGDADFLPDGGMASVFKKMVQNAAPIYMACGPERIFGQDKHGHVLIATRVSEIIPETAVKLSKSPGALAAMKLVRCQLNQATIKFKARMSSEIGRRILKHSLVVDMSGLSFAHFGSEMRALIGMLFGLGQQYYPDSLFKIYLINTPFLFRAAFSVVGIFLHPITKNKIATLSSSKTAASQMLKSDGIGLDQLPTWMGGSHPGQDVFELVKAQVQQSQAAAKVTFPAVDGAS